MLASTVKFCDQPVLGLVMVPSQFLLALTKSCTRIQGPELGWFLNPLLMKESQNSVPWVVASWARAVGDAMANAMMSRSMFRIRFMTRVIESG